MTEEEINNHLEGHADMFKQECVSTDCKNDANAEGDIYHCQPCADRNERLSKDEPLDTDTQTLTYGEIKEMLQSVFEQGILRGITEGQNTVLDMINNDPEIDSDTAKYITHLVLGGDN